VLALRKAKVPNHNAKRFSMSDTFITEPDVVLIGAGIMSSTLGVFLKELEPSLSIEMFETLEGGCA
jgi:Malate:quinone oxidoreductase (Mqo)